LRAWLTAPLLFLLTAFLPVEARAQTNAPVANRVTNRYLFVVETSRAMQKRSEGALGTVGKLLTSGLRGQLKPGDTLGVWTFNDELHAGIFPLQRWSSEDSDAIASRVVSYLKAQKFEKQAKLEKVLPVLNGVLKSSEYITVVLVTEGAQDIHGTPFDADLNAAYKNWRDQQQKAKMPFLTVFRGERGTLTYHSVTPAQWALDLPPLPAGLVNPPKPPEPKTTVASKPPVGKPLIVSGKKPAAETAAPTPSKPEPAAAPAAGSTATSSAPAVTPQPPPTTENRAADADTTPRATKPELTPPSTVAAVSTPAAPVTNARVEPPAALVESTTKPAVAVPPAASAIQHELDPSPVPDSRAAASQPVQSAPRSESTPTPITSELPSGRTVATSAPDPSSLTSRGALIAGAGFVVLLVAVLWFWKSRPSTARQGSLITHSLDHHKE
jgi:hypothetical protein